MRWVSADPANAVAYARAEAAWEAAAGLRKYSPPAPDVPYAAERAVEFDAADESRAGGFDRRGIMAIMVAASGLALALPGVRRSLFELGRAHVCTPVTNAHLVCRLLL